jgi:hypothetical protein
VRFHAWWKPFPARDKSIGINAAAMQAKLPNNAQVCGGRNGFAALALGQPTLDKTAQIQASAGWTVGLLHMPVKMQQGTLRPRITKSHGAFIGKECLQLGFQHRMEWVFHRGTGNAMPRNRSTATRV